MKILFIALICLCFNVSQQISVQNAKRDLKNCAENAIKNVYGDEATLYFVYGQAGSYVFPHEILNPRVIVDVQKPNPTLNDSIGQIHNFIIHSKNRNETHRILYKIFKSPFWLKNPNPTRTFFLIISITDLNEVKSLFLILWGIDVINLVILTYNEKLNSDSLKLYTSDPQAPENDCEKSVNFLNEHSCNLQKPIVFPQTLRKYSNCNITLIDHKQFRTEYIAGKLTYYIAVEIMKFLNATPNYKPQDSSSIIRRFDLVVSLINICKRKNSCCSGIIHFNDIVWILPPAKQIPPIEVLKLTLKEIVWISILVTFIVTAVVWWIITKYSSHESTNEFSLVLINVLSITVSGSTSKTPVYATLRVLFISYIVYSIHIQTAFTCNLTQILTMPQYEKPIESLEELANLDYPIMATDTYDQIFKHMNITEDGNHKKILSKVQFCDSSEFWDLLAYELKSKCLIVDFDELVRQIKKNKKSFYHITDSSVTGTFKYVIASLPCNYFCHTFIKIITMMSESVLIDRITKPYKDESIRFVVTNKPRDENNVKLTVHHLVSVFVIWGVGIITATMVFILEFLVHYATQKLNN